MEKYISAFEYVRECIKELDGGDPTYMCGWLVGIMLVAGADQEVGIIEYGKLADMEVQIRNEMFDDHRWS